MEVTMTSLHLVTRDVLLSLPTPPKRTSLKGCPFELPDATQKDIPKGMSRNQQQYRLRSVLLDGIGKLNITPRGRLVEWTCKIR